MVYYLVQAQIYHYMNRFLYQVIVVGQNVRRLHRVYFEEIVVIVIW